MPEGPDSSQSRVQFAHPLLRAREYQERKEWESLCAWWRGAATGGESTAEQPGKAPAPDAGSPTARVCALMGIGGAGKTALAERFLRRLPGVTDDDPALPKDPSLPRPGAVFVFSCYDAPNAELLFDLLYEWLARTFEIPDERVRTAQGLATRACETLVEEALERLNAGTKPPLDGPLLLVLDGFEKLQETDPRRGEEESEAGLPALGRITHGTLRAFVETVAQDRFPAMRLLITTRFRLAELEMLGPARFCGVLVRDLPPESAVKLLRARGVRQGNDEDLRRLVRDWGHHALTLDLLGGYIGHFCGGDPRRATLGPADWQAQMEETEDFPLDPVALSLRWQGRKFLRLTDRYRETLRARDPHALAVLEHLCLFRIAVSANILACTVPEETADDSLSLESIPADPKIITEKLQLLRDLFLVQEFHPTRQLYLYTIHPAVRDAMVLGLDERVARRRHAAAKRGLDEILTGEPGGGPPSSGVVLDMLEEIVTHALQSGYLLEAFNIYLHRMGGYWNLGNRLADSERGERMCREFLEVVRSQPPVVEKLPRANLDVLRIDRGQYLIHLGRLAEAQQCLDEVSLQPRDHSRSLQSLVRLHLATALYLSGRLEEAEGAAGELAEEGDLPWVRVEGASLCALILHSQGRLEEAETYREKAWEIANGAALEGQETPVFFMHICLATLLMRRGEWEKAGRLAEASRRQIKDVHPGSQHDLQYTNLLMAEVAAGRGDTAEAHKHFQEIRKWSRCSMELRCRVALAQSHTCLGEAGQNPEALKTARGRVEEGLRIARAGGYGLMAIDLLTTRAQIALRTGEIEAAERDARTALYGLQRATFAGPQTPDPYTAAALDEDSEPQERGIFPMEELGRPTLLAATHPECGYAWGEAEARQVLGQARLAQAGRELVRLKIGRVEGTTVRVPLLFSGFPSPKVITPESPAESATTEAEAEGRRSDSQSFLDNFPEPPRSLIHRGQKELRACAALRVALGDPKEKETREVLNRLENGILPV